MPYIKHYRRQIVTPDAEMAMGPGELNYQITCLIQNYYHEHPGYSGVNDVMGALEGAKLEFYRRVAVPYEETKIAENGDVY